MSLQDWRQRDRERRERLERASPGGARANMAGMLNKMAQADAGRELPGLLAIEAIRKGQKHGYKTAANHTGARAIRAGGRPLAPRQQAGQRAGRQ
jgi:hypothetical protein